jgi:hypothetical protein
MICNANIIYSLLMCPPESLREQAGWGESIEASRENLLSDLSGKFSLISRCSDDEYL